MALYLRLTGTPTTGITRKNSAHGAGAPPEARAELHPSRSSSSTAAARASRGVARFGILVQIGDRPAGARVALLRAQAANRRRAPASCGCEDRHRVQRRLQGRGGRRCEGEEVAQAPFRLALACGAWVSKMRRLEPPIAPRDTCRGSDAPAAARTGDEGANGLPGESPPPRLCSLDAASAGANCVRCRAPDAPSSATPTSSASARAAARLSCTFSSLSALTERTRPETEPLIVAHCA